MMPRPFMRQWPRSRAAPACPRSAANLNASAALPKSLSAPVPVAQQTPHRYEHSSDPASAPRRNQYAPSLGSLATPQSPFMYISPSSSIASVSTSATTL